MFSLNDIIRILSFRETILASDGSYFISPKAFIQLLSLTTESDLLRGQVLLAPIIRTAGRLKHSQESLREVN